MCLKKPTLDDLKIYQDILSFWTPQKYDMKDIEDYWSIPLEHLSHFYRAATLIAELQQVHQGLQLESLTMDLCQKPRSPKGLIGKIGETRGFYPWVSPPKGCRFPRKPKLKKKHPPNYQFVSENGENGISESLSLSLHRHQGHPVLAACEKSIGPRL